ncbi:MAG: hypothetical protein E7044_12995 [Lentisphaerae bacterium]|nr:hypothetical protein [Lentisphaerota bacterium]
MCGPLPFCVILSSLTVFFEKNLSATGGGVLRGRGTIKTEKYGIERNRTEKWCATEYPITWQCLCVVWLGRRFTRTRCHITLLTFAGTGVILSLLTG